MFDDADKPGGDFPANNGGELGDEAGVAAVERVSRGKTPLGVDGGTVVVDGGVG